MKGEREKKTTQRGHFDKEMPGATYLLNRIESRICRLNGIKQSDDLPRKAQLCQSFSDHMMYSNDQLPPKVDLRSNMTPVEDQSRIGSW